MRRDEFMKWFAKNFAQHSKSKSVQGRAGLRSAGAQHRKIRDPTATEPTETIAAISAAMTRGNPLGQWRLKTKRHKRRSRKGRYRFEKG